MSAPTGAPTVAPYGSWASPLSAEALAAGGINFSDLRSANGRLYWSENVPARGGEIALFSYGAGATAQVTPNGANVRTRVHEYGGAPFVVVGDTIYYSQLSDQRLYELKHGRRAERRDAAGLPLRRLHRLARCRQNRRLRWCACEKITRDPAHVRNALVRLPLPVAGPGEVLFDGSDFVSYPRLSPDGRRLAFITWNHPNMPWDGTELRVAELTAAGLKPSVVVAGGAAESVLEPQWGGDGTLYFISDRSGFWNLYADRAGGAQPIWPRAAEFAAPLWQFGQSNYVLLGDGRAVVCFRERGIARFGRGRSCEGHGTRTRPSLFGILALDPDRCAARRGDRRRCEVARVDREHRRCERQGDDAAHRRRVAAARRFHFERRSRSIFPVRTAARRTRFTTRRPIRTIGPSRENCRRCWRWCMAVPTSQASPALRSNVQFWTSRGIAVVDVNYGGSSGYGRAYRQLLNGNWGVVDVEDVIAAVRFLVGTKRADAMRTAISGGSAGGYTVLVALSTSDVFHAGTDRFGVSDMTALARDTHKFESRYIDSLIGPLPEAQAVYDSRSPLNHLDGFKVPVLVLQGADDPVVPPNQSQRIVDALRARHVPVAYILYQGESHGFRKPETIIQSQQAELSFYGQIFGFTPADRLPPLPIEGLARSSR